MADHIRVSAARIRRSLLSERSRSQLGPDYLFILFHISLFYPLPAHRSHMCPFHFCPGSTMAHNGSQTGLLNQFRVNYCYNIY